MIWIQYSSGILKITSAQKSTKQNKGDKTWHHFFMELMLFFFYLVGFSNVVAASKGS